MRQALLRHCDAHALRNQFRPSLAFVDKQDGKLFTTVARSQIALSAQRPRHRSGNRAEAAIAGGMAIVVVVTLEMIDIDEKERDVLSGIERGEDNRWPSAFKVPPMNKAVNGIRMERARQLPRI